MSASLDLARTLVDLGRGATPMLTAEGTLIVVRPGTGQKVSTVAVRGVTETDLTIPRDRWHGAFITAIDAAGVALNGRTVSLLFVAGSPRITDVVGG